MFGECAEGPGRGRTVPLGLHQNVEDIPVLVHCSPQVFLDSADLDEHFVEVPLVSPVGCPQPQLAGELGPEPGTRGANRLVRHGYSTVISFEGNGAR